MTIIHISTDYPDSVQSAKTRAIANLVEATADRFDHQVYSLNRRDIPPASGMKRWLGKDWGRGIHRHDETGNISSWTYAAPSRGLFLRSSLHAVADILADDIARRGLRPTLIQGHKLSMEGLIARRLARHFNVPFALSIQGNTDRSILKVRRDLWPDYGQIFHQAAMVFPFAPWALRYCEQALGQRNGPVQMLPCITEQDRIIAPQEAPDRIMTAFHLRHWQIKNFDRLVKAANRVRQGQSGFTFDIYGGGEDGLVAMLQRRIDDAKAGGIALKGSVAGADMQAVMNRHAGFCMVSRRESYGMVFAEALLAGCPIVYPADAAVDGYYDGQSFALAVAPQDDGAIAEAMRKILRDQKAMKQDLAAWQQSGAAREFQRDTIRGNYARGLGIALGEEKADAG
ncbi:MAG: glycosyltransferase [Pseudomonadota bacterium]